MYVCAIIFHEKEMKKTILLFSVILTSLFAFANCDIDSLYNLYIQKEGRQQESLARNLVNCFTEDGYYDYDVSVKHINDKQVFQMLLHVGLSTYAYEQNDFQHAIQYALLAESFTPKDSLNWRCSCYELLNVSYQRIGDYTKALEYAQKAYDAGSILQDEPIRSNALNSLAAIHCSTGHPEDALQYINQAIDIERGSKAGNGKSLAIRLGSKSEILSLLNRYDEALKCIEEALSIDSAAGRNDKVGIRLSQKAGILMNMRQWKECQRICLQAMKIFEANGSAIDKIITLKQMGICEREMRQYHEAEQHLLEAEQACKDIKFQPLLWKIQYELSQLYRRQGKLEQAISYMETSYANKASLNKEEFDKILGENKIKYETLEKEQQINLQNITIKNQRVLSIVLICILVLICIVAIISYHLAIIRKKRNKELAEMNRTKDRIFFIVSHDLRNPVAAQKQVIDYMVENYDVLEETDKKEQLEALKQSQDGLKNLISNLLDWSSVASGRFNYKPTRVDLNTLVRKSVSFIDTQRQKKNITIRQQIQEQCFVYTDVNITEIILRNILSNAIKFSHQDGIIDIQSIEEKQVASIAITDYGIGMTEEQLANLFTYHNSTTGTAGEPGSGIGLIVCKKLADMGNEKLSVTSKVGKGSTFSITMNKIN